MLKVEWRKYLAVCSCILLLFGLSFATIFTNGEVRAHDVSYDVSINSTLSVALPYNNIILDLNPYNKTFEHKGMSMVISTNSNAGYEMTLTSTGGATSLTDEQDNAKTIETLPVLAGGYNESDFVANKWGYSLNGANYQPFVSGATLAASTEGTSAAVSLDFASKVDYSQAPGSYSIELNFNAVGHISPLYMQNLSSNLCTTTPTLVADIRDEQQYYIQRLADGNCWMMTNLNLGGVDFTNDLNRYNTNITGVIEARDFLAWKKNNNGGGTATLDVGEFYSQTGVDATSQTPYGTLYNYYAASAGTISGAYNADNATEDICPAGWEMPTAGFWDKIGYYKLYTSYYSNALMRASMADDGAAFTLSGMFYNGVPTDTTTHGYFWSSSVYDGTGEGMFGLGLDTTSVTIPAYFNRRSGMAIRCILKEDGGSSNSVVPIMQDFNTMSVDDVTAILSDMETDVAYTMKDSRDNQIYTVAKLKDGKVWMLDNLRLGGDTAIELKPEDTNITSERVLPASGTVCFVSSSCTGMDGSGGTIGSTKTGNGYTVPAIDSSSKDTVALTTYGNGSGKIGVYYNYCAVTAGTYCPTYSSSNGGGGATQDICPAGWHMPQNSSADGTYYKLKNTYYTSSTASNANSFQYNLSTPLSGGYRSGSTIASQDTVGYLWTSSPYSSSSNYYMYSVSVQSSSVNTSQGMYRYYGIPVRCVMNDNNSSNDKKEMATFGINTMQELGALSTEALMSLETSMQANTKYEIKDSRDNQTYTVAKLADGNIWMTKNLNLGAVDLVQDLNSSNTNISTTISADVFDSWKKDSGSATYTDEEFIPVTGYTLYNYCAASAGTYCYEGDAGTGNATQDICPAGWKLPTGAQNYGEFTELIQRYDGYSNTYLYTNFFGANTTFSTGAPSSSTYGGYYWASTPCNSHYMNTFRTDSSSKPSLSCNGNYGARSSGYAIRCNLSKDRNIKLKVTMQDFNNLSSTERDLVISIMQTGKNYEIKDSRDNQSYTIAKLKDGNVWMTQNLNLGVTDLTQDLTPANTNTSATVDAATFNGWRKESGSQTRIAGEFIPKSGIDSNSQTPYGVLYNYCAASAGTYCFNIERDSNGNSTQDICPAGWRLPTGGSSSELYKLTSNSYSGSASAKPVIYNGAGFAVAGYFYSGAPTSAGTGYYWSSTYYSDLAMYARKINTDSTGENITAQRYYGYSVRCILKQD